MNDIKKIKQLENKYSSIVGSQQYLRSRYDMDSKSLINKVKKIFK